MKKDKEWLKNEIEKTWHSGHPRLGEVVEYEALKHLIDQLDEPDLPVIPQFVADWIEYAKKECATLSECLIMFNFDHKKAFDWINTNRLDREEVIAKAWLDDYTIEPEKKYILKNQRGFVSSMIVQQSQAKLKSNIRINYTEHEEEARKFNKYEKEFFTEVGHLEVEEVTE